jgi:hypothetical protein
MIGVAKVISTSFDEFKRLIVKVLYRGKITDGRGDVRTPIEASPFGIDSNPTEKKVAIYIQPTQGQYYTIGYLNTNRLAETGETRFFSTDNEGALKAYVWLKKDGILELNGKDNFAVKFNQLKTEFNKLKSDFNDLVDVVNSNSTLIGTHTHPYYNVAVPATTSPWGTSGQMGAPNTSNIDTAKNIKIKTND